MKTSNMSIDERISKKGLYAFKIYTSSRIIDGVGHVNINNEDEAYYYNSLHSL